MTAALHGDQEHEREREREHEQHEHEHGNLQTLLAETRILLPGTQVFVAFLATLPFTQRFTELDALERNVFIATFLATLLALVCFETPAAYHRLARHIHHKAEFKRFANALLIVGLVPVSVSVVLATFLVTSIAIGRVEAYACAGAMGGLVAVLWWVLPLGRVHDRLVSAKEHVEITSQHRGVDRGR